MPPRDEQKRTISHRDEHERDMANDPAYREAYESMEAEFAAITTQLDIRRLWDEGIASGPATDGEEAFARIKARLDAKRDNSLKPRIPNPTCEPLPCRAGKGRHPLSRRLSA